MERSNLRMPIIDKDAQVYVVADAERLLGKDALRGMEGSRSPFEPTGPFIQHIALPAEMPE